MKAIDIANALVKLSDDDSGDVVTNLKLQKLVYYVQGFHLAFFNEPIFEDKIVAWEHGPVVVGLYHDLKRFKSGAVELEDEVSSELTADQLKLISDVNTVYGQFSAWKLRDMTHLEAPWMSTKRGEVIDNELIKNYFKTIIPA